MMSGNRFEQTFEVALQPSKWLMIFIVGLHLVVAMIALLTPAFPLWLRLIMALIIGVSGYKSLNLHYWRTSPVGINALRWLESGEWQIQTVQNPSWQLVTLAKHSFGSRLLFVLNFKQADQRHLTALVLPDSMSEVDFQSLMMRWGRVY